METMPMPQSPITPHAKHAEDLLTHAQEMIDKGDRLQASEKIWGAVAHKIKGIARARRWGFTKHRGFNDVVQYLHRQAGMGREMGTLFRSVDSMHTNFYNDTKTKAELQDGLADARDLLRLLEEADAALPPDLPPPPRIRRIVSANGGSSRAQEPPPRRS